MADLHDLHLALQLLAAAGKTAKVSFYFVDADGKLHSGSIAVEQGRVCHVNFQHMPGEDALAAVARLKFAKVSTLPAVTVDVGAYPLSIDHVLQLLDPNNLPAPTPSPTPATAAPQAVEPAITIAPAVAKPAHVFYSHLSMQADALSLLEPLFGTGAGKKLEEFARLSSPMQHPQEFLDRCKQHAAMMVGPKKAEELFKPIQDKLNQ